MILDLFEASGRWFLRLYTCLVNCHLPHPLTDFLLPLISNFFPIFSAIFLLPSNFVMSNRRMRPNLAHRALTFQIPPILYPIHLLSPTLPHILVPVAPTLIRRTPSSRGKSSTQIFLRTLLKSFPKPLPANPLPFPIFTHLRNQTLCILFPHLLPLAWPPPSNRASLHPLWIPPFVTQLQNRLLIHPHSQINPPPHHPPVLSLQLSPSKWKLISRKRFKIFLTIFQFLTASILDLPTGCLTICYSLAFSTLRPNLTFFLLCRGSRLNRMRPRRSISLQWNQDLNRSLRESNHSSLAWNNCLHTTKCFFSFSSFKGGDLSTGSICGDLL